MSDTPAERIMDAVDDQVDKYVYDVKEAREAIEEVVDRELAAQVQELATLHAKLEAAPDDTEELRILRQRFEAMEPKFLDACSEIKEWRIRNPDGYVESALEMGRLRAKLEAAPHEVGCQSRCVHEIDQHHCGASENRHAGWLHDFKSGGACDCGKYKESTDAD